MDSPIRYLPHRPFYNDPHENFLRIRDYKLWQKHDDLASRGKRKLNYGEAAIMRPAIHKVTSHYIAGMMDELLNGDPGPVESRDLGTY